MRVEYHPEAANDLNEAIDHYDLQRPGLGSDLRQEIYAAINRITANPRLYGEVEEKRRRCFVRRFPFSILYRLIDDEVVRILVIRHHRRHSEFGIERR